MRRILYILAFAATATLGFAQAATDASGISAETKTAIPNGSAGSNGAAKEMKEEEKASAPRIDASSPETLQKSYAAVIAALDDDMQQKFALAMTTISVVMSQRPDLGGSQKVLEMLNGKTAEEVIAQSRKLTVYVKRGQTAMKADTLEQFSESVGNILLSLPEDKRAEFSDAVAKLIYDKQISKLSDAEFLRRVNGKTSDEIVAEAAKLNLPFQTVSDKNKKNYTLEKISPEQAEEFRKKNNPDAPKAEAREFLDFGQSLVPVE